MHPTTYDPPNQDGISRWIRYFQPTMWTPRNLAIEGYGCWLACPCPFKVFTFERRHQSSGTSYSRNAFFGITCRLGLIRKWSHSIIYTSGTMRVVSLFFLFVPAEIQHPTTNHLKIPKCIFSTHHIPPRIAIKHIRIFIVHNNLTK